MTVATTTSLLENKALTHEQVRYGYAFMSDLYQFDHQVLTSLRCPQVSVFDPLSLKRAYVLNS